MLVQQDRGELEAALASRTPPGNRWLCTRQVRGANGPLDGGALVGGGSGGSERVLSAPLTLKISQHK